MKARLGLIPPIFLVLVLSLILVSCSGGGSSAPPQTLTAPSPAPPSPTQPPSPASLIWSTPTGIFRSQTDGSGLITLAHAPDLLEVVPDLAESVVIYRTRPDTATIPLGTPNLIWKADIQGGGTQQLVETWFNIEVLLLPEWVISA
jgi:hypothetical protein